jgi:hypothetical protein
MKNKPFNSKEKRFGNEPVMNIFLVISLGFLLGGLVLAVRIIYHALHAYFHPFFGE